MELAWPTIIGGAFGLSVVVAGSTWAVRYDRIEDLESRVEFYEKADTLKLLKMLESLEKSNSHLTEQLSNLTDYVQTKEENAKLVALVKEKEAEANLESNKRKDRETELLDQIAAVEKDRSRVTSELKDKLPTLKGFILQMRNSLYRQGRPRASPALILSLG